MDLPFNETFTFLWTFSGLNVNISRCSIESVSLAGHSKIWTNNTELFTETTTISIRNSSFGNLDLKSVTKAQISKCYIDGEFKDRPTLITTINSDLTVQNCHFENFVNHNGSTILLGHNNSHVTIDNSVFIQHNSSKAVLFLQNNSSMHIGSSIFSQNVASCFGFSAISLYYMTCAIINNTTFRNNSALFGGAMIAADQSRITLTNCTISSNKATKKITQIISKGSICTLNPHNIGTFPRIMSFKQTSSYNKEPETLAAHLAHPTVRLGLGGAVCVAKQSQLLVTNCVFEHNSAQVVGGTIMAGVNVTLDIRETTFVGNEAWQAGAIDIQQQAHL